MTVLSTIVLLGVLIFVHELGHFLAARSVGVRVERFSIGLGPRVFGVVRGETEYVLSAIPLGGYVKMGGMDDEVMETIEGGKVVEEGPAGGEGTGSSPLAARASREGDFDTKPVWARVWVISAGVTMNMVFALATYTLVAALWGSPSADTTRVGSVRADLLPAGASELAAIPPGATLVQVAGQPVSHWGEIREAILGAPDGALSFVHADPDGEISVTVADDEERERVYGALDFWLEPVIDAVNPGTPADRGGIRPGDRIVAVDGVEMRTWPQFMAVVQGSPEAELAITLARDGGTVVRTVVPDLVTQPDPVTGESRRIGQVGVIVTSPDAIYSRVPPFEAFRAGWDETVYITGMILGFLRDLVTGGVSARSLGSIVAIGQASGQAAAAGFPAFLRFMALFSVNLAILNLLPIPVLDGGHLVFLGIEAIRGRPLSVRQRLRWSQVGFVVLIGIMALALGNDLLRVVGL